MSKRTRPWTRLRRWFGAFWPEPPPADPFVREFAEAMGLTYAEAATAFARAESEDVRSLVQKHGILIQIHGDELLN